MLYSSQWMYAAVKKHAHADGTIREVRRVLQCKNFLYQVCLLLKQLLMIIALSILVEVVVSDDHLDQSLFLLLQMYGM